MIAYYLPLCVGHHEVSAEVQEQCIPKLNLANNGLGLAIVMLTEC